LIERASRVARSGEALSSLSVLLPRDFAVDPGVIVTACGPAIDRGVIELCAARARPFAAEPPPWEAAGWEHTFSSSADAKRSAPLRAAHTSRRAACVALLGIARRPERAELSVTVASAQRVIERRFAIDVRVDWPADERSSLWFHGDRAWSECLRSLDEQLRRAQTEGHLCAGDRISLRAVSRDGTRSRLSSLTLPPPSITRRPHAQLRSIRQSARVGRYATLELVREGDPSADDGSFALTATRRRDAQGEWGVELRCSRSVPGHDCPAPPFAR
jgi:hypothetical protein